MYDLDAEREAYARQYEGDLVDVLTKLVSTVDSKIKKSLARAENPVQGNNRLERQQIEQAQVLQKKLLEDPQGLLREPGQGTDEMSELQREQLHKRIDQLEQKIDFYITTAQ
jgi:hypothetical protein